MGISRERRRSQTFIMSQNGTHEYELVVIAQPEADEPTLSTLNDRLVQMITGGVGQMTATELWGKRALAYPIDGHLEGYYVLHRFAMEPGNADEVERLLRFNENVIRYLLIRTDA